MFFDNALRSVTKEELNMSLKEIEKRIPVDNNPDRMDLDKAPLEMEATVSKTEFKADKQGKNCLYVTLITKGGQSVIQKYTPYHYKELIGAMKESGIEELADVKKPITWRLKPFAKGWPRYVPKVS
jgi:hypothetical protein